MPGPQFHDADENLELQALRELVDTIHISDYRDRNGVGLHNNVAFLKAKALVELLEVVGTPPPNNH